MNKKPVSPRIHWNCLAVVAAMIFCSTSVQALYWDNNGTDPGTGGSGTWSVTDTNWNANSAGTDVTVVFDPNQLAVFEGTAGTVTIAGGGVTANGGLQIKVNNYLIQGGPLTITTATNIEVVTAGHTNTINSVISGTEGIAKTGAGTLVLGGANNFSGTVNLAAGRLIAANGSAIPDASTVALTSSTLELTSSEAVGGVTGAGTVALNANRLTIDNAGSSTFAAAATGTGGITKKGAGILTVSGTTSTYTGSTKIEAGTVSIAATSTLGNSTNTLELAGGVLDFSISRVLTNEFLVSGNSELSALVLSGTRTFTFLTNKFSTTGGALTIRNRALPGTNSGVSVRLREGGVNIAFPIVIGQAGDTDATGTNIILRSDHFTGADQVISGNISGYGKFERNINSSLVGNNWKTILSGSNSFTGGVYLKGGYLGVGSDYALGTGKLFIGYDSSGLGILAHGASRVITNDVDFLNTLPNPTATNLSVGGTFPLTFSGTVLLDDVGNRTLLNVSNTALTTMSGIISGGNASFGLDKNSSGTLVFSGANTYLGDTRVNGGKLLVNNTSGSGTSAGAVTVATGAIFGGTGTVSGSVAVNSGATISAGASVGTFNTGSETWAGGATNLFEINNATGAAGSGWDLINITGGLNITATSGNKFVISINSLAGSSPGSAANFSSASPYSWTIATTTTGITGFDTANFTLNASGFSNSLAGGFFTLSTNNGGNDLVLKFNVAPAAPLITVQPVNVTVSAGGNAQFAITATGDAPLTYVWKRNGTNLSNGGVISGATTATLTLTGVAQGNAGTYSVGVTNGAGGTVSSNATLTVIDPPVITTALTNQTVSAGANVTFFVAASGTTPFTYVWKKNGVTLSGETTNTLNFPSVVFTNSGTYEVFVSNSAGTNSSTSILTVNAAPVITAQPQSVATSGGANANFSVTATGSSLQYLWSKNGVAIGGATDSSYSVTASASTIGFYSVVVSNNLGTATSDTVSLSIDSQAVVFDNFDGYANQAAFEAVWAPIGTVAPTSAELSTTTNVSGPNAIKIAATLTNSQQRNRRSGFATGTVAADNVVIWSFDFYDSNAANAPYRQYCNFSAANTGIISLGLNNNLASAAEGGNYYMYRIVDVENAFHKLNGAGAPLRSTGWHNLKVVISSTEYKFYVDGILSLTLANGQTLRNYNQIDLGTGLSNASNDSYYDNMLVGIAAPTLSISAQPANISTNAGATAVFSVTAAGATVYQWKKNGANISGATASSLTLTNVQVANEGSYSVYIENGYYATNSTSATLTVNAAAAQPTGFISTVAGSGSFVGTPGATYTIQYTDSLSPINWLTLTNVVTDGGTGVGTFTDSTNPVTLPERYYRVMVP